MEINFIRVSQLFFDASMIAFIENTGIAKLRGAADEKDEGKSLRQKTRERITGSMGKVAVDYGILYNAFFKFQVNVRIYIRLIV
jgi:splicing factor 3B subunit 2